MIAAAVVTELAVLAHDGTGLGRLPPVLVVDGVVAAAALAGGRAENLRRAALAAGIALLLLAPAAWSVQTLGHATSGTFPAGGPATASLGGGPGGPGGARGGFGGAPPQMGSAPGPGAGPGAVPGAGSASARPTGGDGFGGEAGALEALAYAKAHGGGAVAVSSQSGAASAIVESGADVVAIGGFSGRESEVDVAWLARVVAIRWVLTDGGGGFGGAAVGRTGSQTVMSAVEQS